MPLTYERLPFPVTLDTLRRAFDEVEQDAIHLAGDLDEAALNRAPSPGAWSAAQCLDHLTISVRQYLPVLEKAVAGASRRATTPPIRPGLFGGLFIRSLEPPVKRRMKAPKKIVPHVSLDREQVWREFRAANDAFRTLIRRLDGIDLNRVHFWSPLGPVRFNVGAGVAIMVAHHRRHVCQLERAITASTATGA